MENVLVEIRLSKEIEQLNFYYKTKNLNKILLYQRNQQYQI